MLCCCVFWGVCVCLCVVLVVLVLVGVCVVLLLCVCVCVCVCVFVCVLISYIMSTCLPSMQAKTLGNPYKGTNSVCLHQPHVDLNTSLRRVHVVAEKASVGHSCWSDSPCFDQPLGLITTTTITIYFIHPSGKLKIKDQIKD